ncbi:unnamed protein product [Caenorhabditis bovis]|uniref:Arf-GAP domain-containing protein n=1 Tax=Caenorhabditis bovis TaxID=2654633 RepID=A0A8S1EMX0_9PELO|nr:unnamed protein product [Caenorhabditis bovis]
MLRGRVDPKKEEQERLQGFLLEMLKEEENKYCADCQAKTPRWAAWNLGVFICIRCAGIHRNLGVHISKVRSVNLDSWTAEQVQTMRVMGNEKARQVYEHDLPPQFRRPTSDSQMEQFIRSKYEQKRYMMRDFVYPRVDVNDLPKATAHSSSKKGVHPVVSIGNRGTNSSNGTSSKGPSITVNNLLDFSDVPTSNSSPVKSANLLDDLAGLSIQSSNPAPSPTQSADKNDDFDDFGSFVSATSTFASPANPTPKANNVGFADFSSAPTTAAPVAPAAGSGLADLASISDPAPSAEPSKKSNADILSLFGTSSGPAAPSPMLVAPGGFTAFGLQAAPAAQTGPQQNVFPAFGNIPQSVPSKPAGDGLFGGLGGINFGGAPSVQQIPQFGIMGQSTAAPQKLNSPTGSSGFNLPNKSNAFADLALGKVMKTNYGQSALHAQHPPSSKPAAPMATIMSTTSTPAPTTAANNDLFDMFAPAPPPMSMNSSSGLDDLLGL